MNDDQKLKIVEALIQIKLALNEQNNIIDNHNINCLNEADLLDYSKLGNGFLALGEISLIIRSL